MAYTRVNWQNDQEGGTPLSAENLNKMDSGIASVDTEVTSIKANLITMQGDIDSKMTQSSPVGYGSFSMNRKAETIVGNYSTTTGNNCSASGRYSFATGSRTEALADYSGTFGFNTISERECQTVIGKYNDSDLNALFIIGNGTAELRENAFAVWDDGTIVSAYLDDTFAKKSDIPDTSIYALKTDIPDVSNFALKSDIPDVSIYATTSYVDNLIGAIGTMLDAINGVEV